MKQMRVLFLKSLRQARCEDNEGGSGVGSLSDETKFDFRSTESSLKAERSKTQKSFSQIRKRTASRELVFVQT